MVGILLLVMKRCEVGGARDCFLEWNYKCSYLQSFFLNYTGFINSISLQGKANSIGETSVIHKLCLD